MPVITHGIILPNGRFLPNKGDGHAKNADRFCHMYPTLEKMKNSDVLNSDEFMITAGCAVVASYGGNRCFKVAKDNNSSIIRYMQSDYEQAGYRIDSYWQINGTYEEALDKIVSEEGKFFLGRLD